MYWYSKILKIPHFIWNYLKDGWEGDDGKFSYRRAFQFVFLVAMLKFGFRPPTNMVEFYVFLTFAILYGLTACIITVQQLITLAYIATGKLPKKEENQDIQ